MTVLADDGQDTASAALATILKERQVTSVFQPLVDLITGEVVAYEALSRGPEGSPLASAAALFAQAETDGKVSELDWICLGSAFDAFLRAGAPPAASLFVNISGGLYQERCPVEVLSVIARAKSDMRVFIEINDKALAADPAGVLETVNKAREFGWGVSIDDVASSPGCVSVLPLMSADVVKLDIRVSKVDEPGNFAPSVGPLLKYVENSHSQLIVKGIESEADAQFARALGATVGQGYHLGAPKRLDGPIVAPRSIIPLIGFRRDRSAVASPRELVEEHASRRMTPEAMRNLGGFFILQALASGSRPVVLFGQGDGEPLEGFFQQSPLKELREKAVLCALFGSTKPSVDFSDLRYVMIPAGDPLMNEPFMILLTESTAVGIVGSSLTEHDGFSDVVLTQDPQTVYLLAEHLIRRIPWNNGGQAVSIELSARRDKGADQPERGVEPVPQRSRWGLHLT